MLGRLEVSPGMANKRFKLIGRVSSASPKAVKPIVEKTVGNGSSREMNGEFVIEARWTATARRTNRSPLSALRTVEKKTRLRAVWTSDDGTTERNFDYVLTKTIRIGQIIIGNPILDKPARPDGDGVGPPLLLPACLRGEARYRRESSSAAAPSDLH
jgi:hypothetical protein